MDKQKVLENLDKKGYYDRELSHVKWNGKEGLAKCPFHEDKNPSLSVNPESGLFNCFACGQKGSIFDFHMHKYGISFQDALNELAAIAGVHEPQKKKIVATYDYRDASGKVIHQTVRYEPKEFSQRRPDGKGKWIYDLKGITPVLYNLSEVRKADTVIIVEGEKDVETLKTVGIVATTNPMGAGKWKADYNQHLQGKNVVIIPDNDEAGQSHALSVAQSLTAVVAAVKIAKLPHIPDKGDVTDFLKDHTKEDLLAVIEQTEAWKAEEVVSLWDSIPTGAILGSMDIQVEWVVDGLIPKGSITTFTGRAGVGKSTFLMGLLEAVNKGELFLGLDTIQMPTLYTDFENPIAVVIDHVRKIGITNTKFWHRALTPRPPKLDDKDYVQYLDLPPCLIVIDSLRASQSQDQNFSKDMAEVLDHCKELRNYGHTIILILHTLKSNESMFSGSQTQEDQADHPLYMYPVKDTKDGKPTEVDRTEELNKMTFFLGTTYKSRYPTSSHLFLKRAGNGKFITVLDPKFEKIVQIWEICHEKQGMNQSEVIELVKSETGWGKDEIRKLLISDKGKEYWSIGRGKTTCGKIFNFLSSALYIGAETSKLRVNKFFDTDEGHIKVDLQDVDNRESSNFQVGQKKLQNLDIDPDFPHEEENEPRIQLPDDAHVIGWMPRGKK